MTTTTTQCFYSLIFCPMPADVHPEAEGINDATLAWAKRNGLCDGAARARTGGARPGILSARVMPRGPRERVQVFADVTVLPTADLPVATRSWLSAESR